MSAEEKKHGVDFVRLRAAIANGEIDLEQFKAGFRNYQEAQLSQVEQSTRKAMRMMGVRVPPDGDGWTDEQRDHYAEVIWDVVVYGPEETSEMDMMTRAMAIYRSFIMHVRAGGEVVYRGVGKEKKLVVRTRKP